MVRVTVMSSDEQDAQTPVLAFLGAQAERRIDTHAASVFLCGDRALKLKRAVRFDYLDFSTIEKRRKALEDELRFNRRTAPMLYRAVLPVVDAGEGQLVLGGEGKPVDWVLEMARFPDGALLADMAVAQPLDPALVSRLADNIVAFHAASEVGPCSGGAERFRRTVEGNVTSLRAQADILGDARASLLSEGLRSAMAEATPLLDRRAAAGRVRHVHGDLHLANIALIDGEPVAFDCLEFDQELATTDVLYDLAFLLMDLWQRGQRVAANIAFNRYCDLSPEDEDGLALLPLFLATRAAIRAHVLAAQSRRGDPDGSIAQRAPAFLDLALSFLEPSAPRLIAVGGLSGSGKSTLARRLGGSIGRAPGARILRSDVLRKRLADIPPETRLPADAYTPEASAAVYRLLETLAGEALGQGQSVIADAVFAHGAERDAIGAVGGANFAGLWLELDTQARTDRVGSRGPDASDANAAVVAAQAGYDTGSMGQWHVIPARGPMEEIESRARECLSAPDICPASD